MSEQHEVRSFLAADEREAFYRGAAGSGKRTAQLAGVRGHLPLRWACEACYAAHLRRLRLPRYLGLSRAAAVALDRVTGSLRSSPLLLSDEARMQWTADLTLARMRP